MKKAMSIAGLIAVLFLSACQMNHIHDTGGGAVAPSSSVQLSGGLGKHP